MACRKVVFVQGGYYHVYNRGANRTPIFRSDENYHFLLRRISQYVESMQVAVIAYCLMPNHYHFVLRQDGEIPLGNFIQAVFNSYTKAFNKMYDRRGTLFEGPFRAIAVDEEEYLIHLCRYVHRNPQEAGLVTNPNEWPYSNYLEWIGQCGGTLVDREFVCSRFAAPQAYIQFVLEYAPPARIEHAVRQLSFE